MWPVLIRELRSAGQDFWNRWYRLLAAIGVLVLGLFTNLFDFSGDGRDLFNMVHRVLFAVIWIFVPLATADCISKERREGTLGLLFLTPLKPWQVVISKSLVQAVRAASMWLAAVPVLTLAFLMGGVTKWEVALSVLIHFSSLCCALAAGILISGCFTEWSRAMVAALLVSTLLLVGFLEAQGWVVWQVRKLVLGPTLFIAGPNWFTSLFIIGNWGEAWKIITGQGQPALYASWARWMSIPCLASMLLLGAAVFISGVVIRRGIKAAGRRPSRFVQVGSKVLFPRLQRGWARRALARNPVGWLEQRSWTARTLQWGWLAVMIAAYSVIALKFTDWTLSGEHLFGHHLLGWGLLAALGLTAAGSFRRERENGMLSLLLISPLRPDEIVLGRVKGLWAQIRWATALFIGGWVFLQGFFKGYLDYFWMLFFTISYLTLPVTGLFCSLWCKTYFSAVLWTIFLGFLYPVALAFFASVVLATLIGWTTDNQFWPTALVVACLAQIGIAYIRGRELIAKLESRSFAI